MAFSVTEFIVASTLMGLAIGVDVALATMARARHLQVTRSAPFWIAGVSATHTLFPMLGYGLAYMSVQIHPLMSPFVGIVAFACIALFLRAELIAYSGPDEADNDSNHLLVTSAIILAVSWDALWSGPAKSAQVIGWPNSAVWSSFLLVGVLVFAMAVASYQGALKWRKFADENGRSVHLSLWVQYSVIGYFGLLALTKYTLSLSIPWWVVLAASATAVGLFMLTANRRAMRLAI